MEKVYKFFFINTNETQTVTKNAFWLFVGELSMRLAKLVVFIYAARILGVYEWGLFSYTIAIMTLFAIISDGGINSIILIESTKNPETRPVYTTTGLFLKVAISVIASLSILGFMVLNHNQALGKLLPITALILFLDNLREFGFIINRIFSKMEQEAFSKMSYALSFSLLAIYIISPGSTAMAISVTYVLSSIIGLLLLLIITPKLKEIRLQNFKFSLIRKILVSAWPIAITSALGAIISSVDTLILGIFYNAETVGLYSAAQKPIQIIYLIPILLGTSALPAFSKFANDDLKINTTVNQTINLGLFLVGVIILCILFFGGYIFTVMFGTEYIKSIILFKIMALSALFNAPVVILSNAIFAIGKQKMVMRFIFLTTSINVVLCLSLIPKTNATGAAIAVLVSQMIGSVVLIYLVNKHTPIKYKFNLKSILFAPRHFLKKF